MVKFLKQVGAKKEVLDAAANFRCDTCDRLKTPPRPPVASLKRATKFNERVHIDTAFYGKQKILSILDEATSFHLAVLITSEGTKNIYRA